MAPPRRIRGRHRRWRRRLPRDPCSCPRAPMRTFWPPRSRRLKAILSRFSAWPNRPPICTGNFWRGTRSRSRCSTSSSTRNRNSPWHRLNRLRLAVARPPSSHWRRLTLLNKDRALSWRSLRRFPRPNQWATPTRTLTPMATPPRSRRPRCPGQPRRGRRRPWSSVLAMRV